MKCKIHIGTSGWSYRHWRGTFYPEDVRVKDHFAYYAGFFNTVELNNPFYRLPPKQTFVKCKEAVADDFVYAIKASRFITHMKKLKDPAESLANFLENVAGLDEKLGVILFQLPPGWKCNIERLSFFLKNLPQENRCVFEFRNNDRYNEEVYALLEKYNCGFCIYELAGHVSPMKVTADFVYVRLHGPTNNKYQGSYSDAALSHWAARCKAWAAEGKDVYVYFDNDEAGYAAFNALTLKKMVGGK